MNVSCRLPDDLGKQLESAVTEKDTTRSKLLRQAIRNYVETNHDNIQELSPNDGKNGKEGVVIPQSRVKPYDPMVEFQ